MTNKNNPIVDALLNAGKEIYVEYQKQQKQPEQPQQTNSNSGGKTIEFTSDELNSIKSILRGYRISNGLFLSQSDQTVIKKILDA